MSKERLEHERFLESIRECRLQLHFLNYIEKLIEKEEKEKRK